MLFPGAADEMLCTLGGADEAAGRQGFGLVLSRGAVLELALDHDGSECRAVDLDLFRGSGR